MADPIVDPQGFSYGMGAGWLPFLNELYRAVTTDQGVKSQTGLGLLGSLTNLLTSPTAGPLGLAAAAKYGGPQGIAAATEGQGIDMSKQTSMFDQILNTLVDYTSLLGAKPEDAPIATNPANPPGTPSTTPVNPTSQFPDSVQGRTDWGPYMADLMGVQRNYDQGGMVPMPHPTPEPTPTPTPRAEKPTKPKKSEPTDEQLNKYGGRQVIEAVKKYVQSGGNAEDYINQLRNVQSLSQMLQAGQVSLPEQTAYEQTPNLFDLPRQFILQMLENNSMLLPYPTLASRPQAGWNTVRPGFADGGGMTIGGQPHYIVDASGNKVAALTEDGKPERVDGVGGVEVTPMDPMRQALYQSRKEMAKVLADAEESLKGPKIDPNKAPMMTPDYAAKTTNIMPREMARLEVGGFQMLPDRWVSGGRVGQVRIPTHGGSSQTRAEQIGPRPKVAQSEGRSFDDLLADLDPGSKSYTKHFAQLLGSVLSDTNMAVSPDVIKALNRGRAPEKLISGTNFATLDPSLQTDYATLLQQMGIIRSPADLEARMRRYQPTALG